LPVDDTQSAEPLGPSSISLRLYPHPLPAPALLDEMQFQANLAVDTGFDGVMLSERHGGAWGQLPCPLAASGWLLAGMARGWAAACPVLLPFRPAGIVAEDVAWLAARYEGRVAVGFGAGGNDPDFQLLGERFESRMAVFKSRLEDVVGILRGVRGPTDGYGSDPAIAHGRENGIPMVRTATTATAARRAAALAIGFITTSLASPAALGLIARAHRDAGGPGPHVLIRRVWIGSPPRELIRRQLDAYRAVQGPSTTQLVSDDDQLLHAGDPSVLAERLAAAAEAADADSICLRVHVAGLDAAAAREQIEALGTDVLPRLRARWPATSRRRG